MPSLAVEVLLCALLLGGVYILSGARQGTPSSPAAGTGKKKKRSKAFKKAKIQTESQETTSQAPVASIKKSLAKPVPANVKETTRNSHGSKAASANTNVQKSGQTGTAIASNRTLEDEDFPPLSSSNQPNAERLNGSGAKATKQVPLAERLARKRPATAVDDMVEADDELQGDKVYSRTMRIVKPQETKPLLLDDTEEDVPSQQERQAESAWQSVPVSSKKPPATRISSSSTGQLSSQSPARSIPGLPELTKKQRQNARKAAEAKAARDEAEHDRLQRLAAHKRALERERMGQQHKTNVKSASPQPQKSKREEVGGGMRAAVYDGKLIWE